MRKRITLIGIAVAATLTMSACVPGINGPATPGAPAVRIRP